MGNVIHIGRLTHSTFVIENADRLRHAPPQFFIRGPFYPTSGQHPRVIIFISDLLLRLEVSLPVATKIDARLVFGN